MDAPIVIQREQLYKEIWKEPASKLAKRYGISGSMVARICKELNVPRPERGYWAKLKHGYKVKIPKLPALKDGQKDVWKISHTNVKAQREVRATKEAVKKTPEDSEVQRILTTELKEHKAIKLT
jgi:hypothetical protein